MIYDIVQVRQSRTTVKVLLDKRSINQHVVTDYKAPFTTYILFRTNGALIFVSLCFCFLFACLFVCFFLFFCFFGPVWSIYFLDLCTSKPGSEQNQQLYLRIIVQKEKHCIRVIFRMV